MPWTPEQAKEKTHLADTPKKQRMWRDVANKVLEDTGDEARAIREANSVIHRRTNAVGGTPGDRAGDDDD